MKQWNEKTETKEAMWDATLREVDGFRLFFVVGAQWEHYFRSVDSLSPSFRPLPIKNIVWLIFDSGRTRYTIMNSSIYWCVESLFPLETHKKRDGSLSNRSHFSNPLWIVCVWVDLEKKVRFTNQRKTHTHSGYFVIFGKCLIYLATFSANFNIISSLP